MKRCGWGKRIRLNRCDVCGHLVIFGRLAACEAVYRQLGGRHYCGHARCIGAVKEVAKVAATEGATVRFRLPG